MKITILTLFPEFYECFQNHSIIKKAISKGSLILNKINIRDFALDGIVDDYVYGGGTGMLLKIEPIVNALKSIKDKNKKIVLLSPRGKTLDQNVVKKMSKINHLVLICGHYEGVDARISKYIDFELSIGNFILTGGEVASLVLIDSLTRLLPNVLKSDAKSNETFETHLLEHDQYTRPEIFDNQEVPKILLSGNHKKIQQWKLKNSYNNTIEFLIKENFEKEK